VYAGHAALALVAKRFAPRVPIAVLVPMAFAPDWVQWTIAAAGGPLNPSLSHSLVSVLIGATVAAAVYWAIARSRWDALVVWLTYVSHWPADFVTAIKALWPNGPAVGLDLYRYPAADVVVESIVVLLCWIVYRRSLASEARTKRIGWLIPVGLLALQIGFVVIQNPAVKQPLRQMLAN
jgi:hypothetical protein